MRKKYLLTSILFMCVVFLATGKSKVYNMADFGLKANSGENASPLLVQAIETIKGEYHEGDRITLIFPAGRYDFHEAGASRREYYISNHDQVNPKIVGIALENLKHVTIDGQHSEFVFHGRMIPLSLLNSENCTLKNFSIDFENPHIAQIKVLKNDPQEGITFEVAPWVKYRIGEEGYFETTGEGWVARQSTGIAFEAESRHIVYNTSDLFYNTQGAQEVAPRTILAPQWKDKRLIPGTVIAMRTWYRPTPGLFLSHNRNTRLQNVKVHYAEGMGLLAQLCENITLDGFSVCLKGENDPRYFTTQADATHFSGCKGKIISKNGLYEGMMDDAINIHGTYLKVIRRLDNNTLVGRYMHDQAWGFEWGRPGDAVQFVNSSTMELVGNGNKIKTIHPYDKKEITGAREYLIQFEHPIDTAINARTSCGIENLEWTPEVVFSNNTVRNNRARGALFSTPKKTIVENNTFDHTSGTAILLCGDCNGWFETGACREVIIRNNRFINALTNMFQFTNAIISIYPEIPDLKAQKLYFHGGPGKGVIIENNFFETFDQPVVYAKSLDGFVFRKNTIRQNQEYPAFHWNKKRFLFERVKNIDIRHNKFDGGFDYRRDVTEK